MNGYEWYIFWPCLSFLSFLFPCPESLSRWMLRSTKRSFENGPRSLKKLELKLIQISADSPAELAEFDTSTQALTNSNQQSLNLNLSKHLNFTGHYTLFYKFVYRFLTNLSVFLSVPCGTCSPQDRAEAYFGSELEMASSVASKDCAFLLFPRHLPTNDYCGVCVFGALKFKDSCLCFRNLGKQPTILAHSTLG